MSGTALNANEYTWNRNTGLLRIPYVTGDVVVTVTGEHIIRNVTQNLTNVTSNGANTVADGATYQATFTANAHYQLPTTITVTMGGNTLDVGQNQYTWNSGTGELSIPNVSGDIVITVTGTQIVRNVSYHLTNVTRNGPTTVNDGGTYQATFTADAHYSLPQTVTVTMGGTALNSNEYTWDSTTGTLSVPVVTDDLVVTVTATQIVRNVTYNLTKVITNGRETVSDGGTYQATFTAYAHYRLPATITVSMGGTILDASQNEYTWNSTTGAFSISNVTGDLVITVTGEQIVRNVTHNLTNVTTNGASTVNEGATYTAIFTAASGYSLPSTITVVMGGQNVSTSNYTWNSTTGAFSISNVSGDISITITGQYATDITEVAYNDLLTLNNIEANLGTNIKAAVDDGEVSKVLKETVDGNVTVAVIPTGFTVSSTPGENTISQGLVVRDGSNNEFVWIPVRNISDMAVLQTGSSTNYRGVLYNWATDPTGQTAYSWSSNSTSYREPANLASTTTVNSQSVALDSQEAFTYYGGGTYSSTMYQTEFNSMVKSVGKYKGFYVGRYETGGFNGSTIVVKAGETGTTDSNSANNSINYANWYKMYKMQKDFASSNTNVASTMIWGCQWDQVMKFADDKEDGEGNTFDVTTYNQSRHTNSLAATGNNTNDKVQNIYDLEGNVYEWTLEANYTDSRDRRGGYCSDSSYSASRYSSSPSYSFSSSRKPSHTLYKRTNNNT